MTARVRPLIDNGDGTHTVVLTRGMTAVIDSADVALVDTHCWCAWTGESNRSPYAQRDGALMHRLIAGAAPTETVDHINGNGLDNRRCNLRIATRAENSRNRAVHKNNVLGVKGVHQIGSRYRARIRVLGTLYSLGQFATLEEAKAAYAKAADQHFGEFARTA